MPTCLSKLLDMGLSSLDLLLILLLGGVQPWFISAVICLFYGPIFLYSLWGHFWLAILCSFISVVVEIVSYCMTFEFGLCQRLPCLRSRVL